MTPHDENCSLLKRRGLDLNCQEFMFIVPHCSLVTLEELARVFGYQIRIDSMYGY
jgi:hypothetical protein